MIEKFKKAEAEDRLTILALEDWKAINNLQLAHIIQSPLSFREYQACLEDKIDYSRVFNFRKATWKH